MFLDIYVLCQILGYITLLYDSRNKGYNLGVIYLIELFERIFAILLDLKN